MTTSVVSIMGSKNIRLTEEQAKIRPRTALLTELGLPPDAQIELLEYWNQTGPRHGPTEGPLICVTHEDIQDG